MKVWRRLRVRLLASYLLVIGLGAGVFWAISRTIAPEEFQRRLRLMGNGRGRGPGASGSDVQGAAIEAIDSALLAGLIVAIIAAGVVAVLVSMRLLRPLSSVGAAAKAMAQGDYSQRVPIPTEEELADLATNINRLGSALEQTEQRRVELIGEVAHELRSPLTTIGGYMEALLDGVREPTQEVFAAVAAEAARLHRLADDLTSLSQAEEGALQLECVDADLTALADAAVDKLRVQFEHRDVELRVTGLSAPINVDPDRITQVLINLIGNALTHTPDGGKVSVESGTEGGTAWVTVSDTGSGIEAENLERIFERFYRVPNPQRPAGRGIGLTIARSTARAHGGEVTATSPGKGAGATFRLTLPAREA